MLNLHRLAHFSSRNNVLTVVTLRYRHTHDNLGSNSVPRRIPISEMVCVSNVAGAVICNLYNRPKAQASGKLGWQLEMILDYRLR